MTQRFEQDLADLRAVTASSSLFWLVALASSSRDMAVVVGLDVADSAAACRRTRCVGVEIGVVVDLHERLERDAEPLAVIEDAVVVIRESARARD